jgi:flagellin-like hook-associated protein FlgL
MIGSVGSSTSYSASSKLTQGLSAIRAQWSTSLSLASLGSFGLESSGVSPYSLNPAAASLMDSLQTDLAVQTQAVIGAGYADAKAAQVDSSLGQVNKLLTTVQVDILAMADGTLTDSQKSIKQMEINSALQSIDMVGNMTSFAGQKLLTGKPIAYNATTDPQNEISVTPPKVNTGSLGNASGKLSDLSTLLDEGKYDDAMKIAQDAQSTIRNGRADAGNFTNAVQIQKDIVLDQMENTVSLYNQAASIAYGSKPYGRSSIATSLLSMNSSNARYQVFQTLIAGMNR